MTTVTNGAHAEHNRAASKPCGDAVRGWYLYGITRGAPLATVLAAADAVTQCDADHATEGSDAGPLQLLACGGLAAVVRPVRLEDFSAAVLQERLQSASELEALARSHNHVTDAIHRQQAILPAKLGSVYASAGDVIAALQPVHDTLLRQLARLEGRDEWAVHVFADAMVVRERVAATDPAIRRLRAAYAAALPGRAFFLERQLRDELDAAAQDALTTRAQSTYDRLAAIAVSGEARRSGPAADDARELEILRATFLVPRDDADRFEDAIRAVAVPDEGVRCEWSGPWPPYSFAARADEEDE